MINIFQPDIDEESNKLLNEVFQSNWLGRGNYVKQFEELFSKYLKVEQTHIHTLASCSDAIFIGLRSFDLPKDSEVIIPSISFPAVPSAVKEAGLSLKVIDIDPQTGNICLDSLKNNFNSNCAAVFLTDYGGIPVNITKVREIVGDSCLILLDAAASLGTFCNGEFSGAEADFVCWSFDSMKLLVCGEGGAAYFKNLDILERFKEYSYLGLPSNEKSGIDRSQADDEVWWEYQLSVPGRRSVFTNINAAIGLPKLKILDGKLRRRSEIRDFYVKELEDIQGFSFLDQKQESTTYSNYFCTLITSKRNNLAKYLKNNDIYTTFRYFPIHKINIFKEFCLDCKNAEKFSDTALNIPIHDSLTDQNVEHIVSSISNFYHSSQSVGE